MAEIVLILRIEVYITKHLKIWVLYLYLFVFLNELLPK